MFVIHVPRLLPQAAKELEGTKVELTQLDVTSPQSVEQWAAEVQKLAPHIDVRRLGCLAVGAVRHRLVWCGCERRGCVRAGNVTHSLPTRPPEDGPQRHDPAQSPEAQALTIRAPLRSLQKHSL